jgi:putative transposase
MVAKLRDGERHQAQGPGFRSRASGWDHRADVLPLADQVRRVEGGRSAAPEALEQENARLKKIVAEQTLDISLLKDLQWGTGEPGAST